MLLKCEENIKKSVFRSESFGMSSVLKVRRKLLDKLASNLLVKLKLFMNEM